MGNRGKKVPHFGLGKRARVCLSQNGTYRNGKKKREVKQEYGKQGGNFSVEIPASRKRIVAAP
jgi:hypothetical protein